ERGLRRLGGHQPRGAQRAGRVVEGRSRKGTSVLYLQRGPGRAGAGRGRRGELTVKSRRRLIIPVAILVIGAAAWSLWPRGGAPNGAIQASGTIEATQVDVAPKIAGRVMKLLVREGAQVHAGQVVAELDTARSAVKAAEAQRDAARAQRDAARVQLSAAAAVVEQARAGLAVAEANRQTIAIREQDVAAARAQLAQARAVLQQAEILRGNTILTAPFAGVVVAKHVEIG